MLDQDAYASPAPPAGKAEAAERALRSAIVHCMLGPGERLSEAKLVKEFALGRGAVRAALSRLQAGGFVTSSARSGWRVAPISAGEIRETCAARRHLEPLLAGVALDEEARGRIAGFAEVHRVLAERPELGSDTITTIRRSERDILECLSARLGMATVSRWLTDLWDRSSRLVNFFEASGPARLRPTDMPSLVEAIASGRYDDAADAFVAANRALETFLFDRFVQSEASVAVRPKKGVARAERPIALPSDKQTGTTRSF